MIECSAIGCKNKATRFVQDKVFEGKKNRWAQSSKHSNHEFCEDHYRPPLELERTQAGRLTIKEGR